MMEFAARLPPVDELERAELHRFLSDCSYGKKGAVEIMVPHVFLTDDFSEDVLDCLIGSFCLSIPLEVIGCCPNASDMVHSF